MTNESLSTIGLCLHGGQHRLGDIHGNRVAAGDHGVGGGAVVVVAHREALHLHAVAVGGVMAADDKARGNVGELHHDLGAVIRQGGHDGAGGSALGLAADAVLLGEGQEGKALAQLQLAGGVCPVGPVLGCAQVHVHGEGGVGNQGQSLKLLDADDIVPGEELGTLVAVVRELDVVEGEVLTEASPLVGHQQGQLVGVLLGEVTVTALALALEEEHGLTGQTQPRVDEGVVVAALLDVGAEEVALAVGQLNGEQLADAGTARRHHDHAQGDADVLYDLMGEVPAHGREGEGCFPVGSLPAPVGIDDIGLGGGAEILVGVGVGLGLGKEAEVVPLVEVHAGGEGHAGGEIQLGVGLTADEPDVTDENVLEGHGVAAVIRDDHDLGVALGEVGGEGQRPAVVVANGGGDGLTHKRARHAGAGGIREAPDLDGLLSLEHHVGGEHARDLEGGADPCGGVFGGGGLFFGGEGGGGVYGFVDGIGHGENSFQKDLTNCENMVYYSVRGAGVYNGAGLGRILSLL